MKELQALQALLAEVRADREKSRSAMDRNLALQRQFQGQLQGLQNEQFVIAQDIERCNGAETVLLKRLEAVTPKPKAEPEKAQKETKR